MTREFESENKAVAVAPGIVSEISLSIRCARSFNVGLTGFVVVVGVVIVVPFAGVVVVVVPNWICADTEDGGVIPKFFTLSLRTSITAISTMISGFDLSMSPMIFSVSAIWSGVPRTMSA